MFSHRTDRTNNLKRSLYRSTGQETAYKEQRIEHDAPEYGKRSLSGSHKSFDTVVLEEEPIYGDAEE